MSYDRVVCRLQVHFTPTRNVRLQVLLLPKPAGGLWILSLFVRDEETNFTVLVPGTVLEASYWFSPKMLQEAMIMITHSRWTSSWHPICNKGQPVYLST